MGHGVVSEDCNAGHNLVSQHLAPNVNPPRCKLEVQISLEIIVGVDGVGEIFHFFCFFCCSSFFSAFFPPVLLGQELTTAIYWENGEFHSDPVGTDPVQNFPSVLKAPRRHVM